MSLNSLQSDYISQADIQARRDREDTVDRTSFPVSQIFYRFRNMPRNNGESDYRTQTYNRRPIVSRQPLATLNISFPNHDDENSRQSYLPAEYQQIQARSVNNTVPAINELSASYVHKRGCPHSLSTVRSKEASPNGSTKRPSIPTSPEETLQPNAVRRQGNLQFIL